MRAVKKFLYTYRIMLLAVVSVAVCLAALFFGIMPLVNQSVSLYQGLTKDTQDIQKLRQKNAVLESLDEQVLKDQLASLLSAVPSDKSLPSLFSTLDALSAETGISVTGLSIQNPGAIASDSGKPPTLIEREIGSHLLPFSLSVDGSLPEIRAFLSTAIGVRRFFRIRRFDMGFTEGSLGTVRMTMDAFYAPLPTKLGSVDQELQPLTQKEEETLTAVGNLPLLGQEAVIEAAEVSPDLSGGKANPFE